jgi:hypothetical protein
MIHPNNQPWCNKCVEAEQERFGREEVPIKPFLYNRPPKYILPKERWKEFGYDET